MSSAPHRKQDVQRENSSLPQDDQPLRPTQLAHELVRNHVQAGDQVIDATVGNGHDTIFLAALVGPEGKVHGFDIQEEALHSTRLKLQDRPELAPQITLHAASHEAMADFVTPETRAVMFNLGYLPGGDKRVITRCSTTVAALQSALELLTPDGIVTIVVYSGHPGGKEEANAVEEFYQSLDDNVFTTTIHKAGTANPDAPYLVVITPTEKS